MKNCLAQGGLREVHRIIEYNTIAFAEALACILRSALCRCRAGEALSQQEALAQQLREAEEMLRLDADEADSLDKVLQAVQATVQVLFIRALRHCICSRHAADTSSVPR